MKRKEVSRKKRRVSAAGQTFAAGPESGTGQRFGAGPARKRILIIAASVLVIAAGAFAARAFFFKPESATELAEIAKRHFEKFPIAPISGTLSPNAPYRAGIDAYRRGDYRLAAKKFWLLSGEAEHWPGLHFYRGLSLLNSGDAASAAAAFEQHLRQTPGARPARWYLALSLLSTGREKQACEQLTMLAHGPGTDYQEKAIALLEELR